MRLLISVLLVAMAVAQCACAQVPVRNGHAAAAALIADVPPPFQMPESEGDNIAGNPSWTAPQPPFRIYGNTWYVGPRGLGVFLITAPTGDVLIDGGVPGDAALIEGNLRALGIHLHDIKWILNTHAHADHAGGIARLARDTGAEVIAGAADVPLVERGGHDDPQYGDRFPFPNVHVARAVRDGEILHLGELALTVHSTPGHTQGNTSWTWVSCDGKRCLHMADVGSLSAPGFKLIGKPNLIADFEHSFDVVAGLPCDIPLAPHPEMVDFWARVDKRKAGDADGLLDRSGCRDYAAWARKHFADELAKQRAAAQAPPSH